MKEMHKQKAAFVRKLKPALQAADPRIMSMQYTTVEDRGRVIAETVLVTREHRDGPESFSINVTGDSEKAMLCDITRALSKEWGLGVLAWVN